MSTRTSKSKTETNANLLKSLLKLPGNKFCCDCKTADHPRWASWNLGIFLCIRCSGIHRSMGTHISRVKSVDLDAWTDEQTQSMIKWGNKKANSYWEGKLDAGHVPAEGKIDNFVKTKYISRRWVSQDERPDPDTLSDDEQSDIAPSYSTTKPGNAAAARSPAVQKPAVTDRNSARNPVQTSVATPSISQPIDSLLGMDFSSQVPTRPLPQAQASVVTPPGPQNTSNISLLSSSTPAPTPINAAPRNDLKTSIMSLYASAPKPQQHAQSHQYTQQRAAPASSSLSTHSNQRPANAFDDLNGLFGGMNVQAASSSSSQRATGGIANVGSTQYRPAQTSAVPANQMNAGGRNNATSASHTDPWHTDDDAWGAFQGDTKSGQQPKQSSAFDDLYSTSDVWK